MYYQQKPPKEPSGCIQTIIISRMLFAILLIPILIIIGSMLIILFAFYALTVSPFLALLVIGGGAGIIIGVARWESRRVAREIPKDE
jgi:hypothetical protein